MISRLLGRLRKLPNASRVSKHRVARFTPNAVIHDLHDGSGLSGGESGLMIRRSRSCAIASSMGDTFGSSFSARPTPAAAAYCTREAVHSFAGYDYSSRHKDRWAPALDRLLSLRRRIELGHPR